jgi:spore coat polysaccharide biosynthesis protein SpsF (cytidylyltransferase family)
MSSTRFPGKVLAKLGGMPLLAHLIGRLKRELSSESIVVATSDQTSDDPLAAYAATLGVRVFRGPLENVALRFQMCVRQHPCDWFFRISADSPLFDARLVPLLSSKAGEGVDLVTNVFPRSYPKGHSLELLWTKTFLGLDLKTLSPDEQEHVTQVYYHHPDQFRIVNVDSGDPSLSRLNYCVDTPEDLGRLEAQLAQERT